MRRTRAPRHRGRWTPFHPRALRGAAPALLAAATVAVLGATATVHFTAERSDVAVTRTSAVASVTTGGSDPIEFSTDPSVASAARVRAPTPLDPRPLQSAPATTATPVHLRIARIGVDVDLTRLDRREDGTLEPPTGLMEAGWYRDSAVPGTVGPSVIAGHVDDTEDAGIFARLHELASGDEIVVTLSDGTSTTFTADFTADVSKAEFPTDAVYGATRTPQLRLITCNGPYDFESMHYRNNLVLFASLRA